MRTGSPRCCGLDISLQPRFPCTTSPTTYGSRSWEKSTTSRPSAKSTKVAKNGAKTRYSVPSRTLGDVLLKPILNSAGKDISNWFDKKTGNVRTKILLFTKKISRRSILLQLRTHIDPVTNCRVAYTPQGRFIHVPRAFRRPIGRTIMMLCCADESRARFVVIGTQLARSELELRFVRFDGAFDLSTKAARPPSAARRGRMRTDSTRPYLRGERTHVRLPRPFAFFARLEKKLITWRSSTDSGRLPTHR